MRFLTNWKKILKKAWSIKLILFAAFLSGVEVVLPLIDAAFPPGIFAVMSFMVAIAAFIARLVVQQEVAEHEDKPEIDSGA